jgi:uncharacterized protein
MKIILEDKNTCILRFDRGEEVIQGLKDFFRERGNSAAYFSGIGAAENVVLSFYDLEAKRYEDKSFAKMLEVTAFSGNIGILEDGVALHAHGSFSDKDMAAIGGHVQKLIAAGTMEVVFTSLAGSLRRAHDSETGLNLMA